MRFLVKRNVYHARDPRLDDRVALKIMHPALTDSAWARASFNKEVRLGSRIHHRNVVRVFELGEAGGVPYLSLEFIDGEPLYHLLQTNRPLPSLHDVSNLIIEICHRLSAIHSAGVVHCDLTSS